MIDMPTSSKQLRAAATLRDPRWAAVLAHDATADGKFVYAVKTTGVYCRPSCKARPARPENVSFHATCADAERAGFRPCRRCRPGLASLAQQQAAMVANACRAIEQAETAPSLATLARHAGLSAFHFHRVFKTATGVTPKAYAAAQRAQRVRGALARGERVTDALFAAGYNSSGRFYEQSNAVLGMTPSTYRAGGKDLAIHFALGRCALGAILVASSPRGVCAIFVGDNAQQLTRELCERFPQAQRIRGDRAFERTLAQVVRMVETPARGLDLPLDVRGTAFQLRVWQALQKIPPGTTATYAQIARQLGAPKAARAVANACAANTLAVAIPCHRVVRGDGGLGGYRWGAKRKQALLKREAQAR